MNHLLLPHVIGFHQECHFGQCLMCQVQGHSHQGGNVSHSCIEKNTLVLPFSYSRVGLGTRTLRTLEIQLTPMVLQP